MVKLCFTSYQLYKNVSLNQMNVCMKKNKENKKNLHISISIGWSCSAAGIASDLESRSPVRFLSGSLVHDG